MSQTASNPQRSLPHGALRRWATWQATSRQCGRVAGEVWQLHLPLVTMVGLTLLGVYDCTAATRLVAEEPARAVETARETPGTPVAAVVCAAAAARPAMVKFEPARLGVAAATAARTERSAGAAVPAAVVIWTGSAPTGLAPPRA